MVAHILQSSGTYVQGYSMLYSMFKEKGATATLYSKFVAARLTACIREKHTEVVLILFFSISSHRYWELNECLNIKICKYLISN